LSRRNFEDKFGVVGRGSGTVETRSTEDYGAEGF
jgi:hypothetical protein